MRWWSQSSSLYLRAVGIPATIKRTALPGCTSAAWKESKQNRKFKKTIKSIWLRGPELGRKQERQRAWDFLSLRQTALGSQRGWGGEQRRGKPPRSTAARRRRQTVWNRPTLVCSAATAGGAGTRTPSQPLHSCRWLEVKIISPIAVATPWPFPTC